MYRKYIKRKIDIIASVFAIIMLFPVFLATAFLVRLKIGSPVIFKQQRVGQNEKIFTIYKFRTMSNAVDRNGKPLSDEKRLSDFGKFLRSTSLDELPEFFNILKGDMSLVGPRPLLIEYLPLYSKAQRRRHKVSPGLTGLAQVNGRNLTSWEQRFRYDLKYVKKYSFWLDMHIIVKTFFKVLKRNSKENEVLMPYFTGNKELPRD